jgi:hypothetical protein
MFFLLFFLVGTVVNSSGCQQLTMDVCNIGCKWNSYHICNPLTLECSDLNYGCQKSAFCEFTRGSRYQRQIICEDVMNRPYCKWNGVRGKCIKSLATSSPTRYGNNISLCSNVCWTSNNNRCEDGGLESVSPQCVFGTDCADCGIRNYTFSQT